MKARYGMRGQGDRIGGLTLPVLRRRYTKPKTRYQRRVTRRKRVFRKRVKKVVASMSETKQVRLPAKALRLSGGDRDPRVNPFVIRNGACYNQPIFDGNWQNPATQITDPLMPFVQGTQSNQIVGKEIYSVGVRVEITLTRELDEAGVSPNDTFGYILWQYRKDQLIMNRNTSPTAADGIGDIFPLTGINITGTTSVGGINTVTGSYAENNPSGIMWKVPSYYADNVTGGFSPTYFNQPRANPWTQYTLNPVKGRKLKQGVLAVPQYGVTQTTSARTQRCTKTLFIRTGKKFRFDANPQTADVKAQLLPLVYLMIWRYNPSEDLAAGSDSTVSVGMTHYYKDI